MSEEELYSKLPKAIQNAAGTQKLDSDLKFIEELAKSSLPKSKSSEVEAELKRSFPLLKFHVSDKKQFPRKKKKPLSMREKRQLGLHKLNKKDMKYEEFEELHSLWTEYIKKYLNLKDLDNKGFTAEPESGNWTHFSHLLSKADFHGALMKVVRSKCSSLVGQSGIVIFDTRNTFKIISKDNIVRTIPKQSSVFAVSVDNYTFTIFGKYFCIKPPERSVKKIRTHILADL
ncbi:hypothetical protein L9F63_017783 [Diploptera punctata]|uniref:Ribonuclease P protein subunit p29 n=1 Tax=Diploptera punctata TaxID=6984 RepID=A0AAD7ZXT3_DIPPU|nr:hypothetical protein L9F63_017783 [Diploptera punctata]